MRFISSIIVALIAVITITFDASAQKSMDNPMTKAVMESYETMLKENPADYQVYFRRANEYYNHNQYPKALSDINSALQYAPAKEKDVRFQCYSLRASIYERMKMFDEAIKDLDAAIAIDPSSYSTLYQKANIEFEAGKYNEAKENYQKLQRLNSRSQEALFGLARVAVVEKNNAQANKYCDEAVNLTPGNPDAYMSRGAVRVMMGNRQGAVEDYIMALTLSQDRNLGKPIHALVDMSYTDYNAVINGLHSAISQSPREGIFYYIRGVIAQAHFHYPSAVADFEYIINNYLLDYPGIYRSLAECYYALGRYDEALAKADMAIGSTSDNLAAYVVKSDIKRAMKTYNQAVTAAQRALDKKATYAPALFAKGLALLANKLTDEASTSVGSAVIEQNDNPYYMMTRAWILSDFLDQPDNAKAYYNDVLALDTYPADDVLSLRGFALLGLERKAEADAWMEKVLAEAGDSSAYPSDYQGDGLAEYYGACYYAQSGDLDHAFKCMEQSLKKGYANYHNWVANDEAGINVAPLRDDPRFNRLLTTYSFIFSLN